MKKRHACFNPNLGGLFRDSFWGGEEMGLKLTPVQNSLELCQKLAIWHVSTHTYVVSESIPFSTTKYILILLMSIFFCKKPNFLRKMKSFFNTLVWGMCQKFLNYVWSFCPKSGFWIALNWLQIGKIALTSHFLSMTSSLIFSKFFCFSRQFWSLVQVSCQYHHWFWIHDNFFL